MAIGGAFPRRGPRRQTRCGATTMRCGGANTAKPKQPGAGRPKRRLPQSKVLSGTPRPASFEFAPGRLPQVLRVPLKAMHNCLPSQAEFPQRIVCLTDETAETLCLLGEQERIAGISAYASRPAEVRSKPRVAAFKNANFEKIMTLKPDLALTFSDVQAEITRQLVLRGVTVLNFNQRSVAEILDMIRMLARIVGKPDEGRALANELARGLDEIAAVAAGFPRRPRVFFEEWDEPLIGGIAWVEELIEIAGGEPIFPELRSRGKAQDRVVDPVEEI